MTPRSEQVSGEPATATLPPMNLWERLRKHKVAQWTLAYGAAAYTLLHIVEMISGALDWPHLIVRIVALMLLLGVPVATTLAWFHGHRAQHRISGTELVILAALVALAGGVLWVLGRPHDDTHLAKATALAPASSGVQPAAIQKPPENSVAVLPFVNMSEDKNNEYFADGLTEELIDLLTRVPELRVPARTSSFYFKGKSEDIPTIARRLLVAHVLEGSVRKSGRTLRITAQLIRVDNGYHVWSETYDRQLDDIFKIQDDIAGAVVKALKVSLLAGESPPAATVTNSDTFALYLEARSFSRRGAEADIDRGIDLLRQALRSDPKFAPAWAQLAILLGRNWDAWATIPFEQARTEARDAADRAIQLDPKLAAARVAKGYTSFQFDWDWDTADAEFRKAVQLDPGDAEALMYAGSLSGWRGRFDKAIQFGTEATARDPLSSLGFHALGFSYFCAGRVVEAEAAFRKALELNPANPATHHFLGLMLLAQDKPMAALAEIEREHSENWRYIGLPIALDSLGRRSEADQALAVAEQKFAFDMAWNIAEVYASRNDRDRAFAWMDRAYRQHDDGVLLAKVDPLLKSLRGDPRYQAFLRRAKAPE